MDVALFSLLLLSATSAYRARSFARGLGLTSRSFPVSVLHSHPSGCPSGNVCVSFSLAHGIAELSAPDVSDKFFDECAQRFADRRSDWLPDEHTKQLSDRSPNSVSFALSLLFDDAESLAFDVPFDLSIDVPFDVPFANFLRQSHSHTHSKDELFKRQ